MQPSNTLRSQQRGRTAMLRIGALLLTASASTTVLAENGCQANAEQLRATFDQALVDAHANAHVNRIVNVEDRREFGCHFIFDISDGNQVQGIFLASDDMLKWTPDGASPSNYERKVAAETLIASTALIQSLQSNTVVTTTPSASPEATPYVDPWEGDGSPKDACNAPPMNSLAYQDWKRTHVTGPTAPPGYFYPPGNCKYIPVDPCQRKPMFSAGTMTWMNSSVGKAKGLTAEVAKIVESTSPDRDQLSLLGLTFGTTQSSIVCHQVVEFKTGQRQGGVLSIDDPGAYAPLQITWMRDSEIALLLAKSDRLGTRKDLLVRADVQTPAIQECVGRQTALGIGEQFPGQLWAACADPAYKRR